MLGFIRLQAQTVAAPQLDCVVNDFVGGNTTLTWTNVPNSCGAFVGYNIYAANSSAGPFSLLATITTASQTSYVHIGAASGTWFYYMEADFNCPGATILQSDTIQNEANPKTPQIRNVTVTANNTVVFDWYESTSPQTKAYIVYAVLPNGNLFPIDTVYGYSNSTYTDVNQNPSSSSLSYTVAAMDLCSGNQPSAYNTKPHTTIHTKTSLSNCEKSIRVEWTKYVGFDYVKEYRLMASVNGSTYSIAGTTDSSITTLNFDNFNDGDTVCLFVTAINGLDTTIFSSSNYNCMVASVVQPPKYIYITNITVNNAAQIETTWLVDTLGEILKFNIDNTPDCTNYNFLATVNVSLPIQQFYLLKDTVTPTNEEAFCYQVTVFDSCLNTMVTPVAKSIFLSAELTDYYEVSLNWNSFDLHGATVNSYKLYRDYGAGYQQIASFNAATLDFRDSLYTLLNEKGNFCYYIEAEYTISLSDAGYTANLTSRSNVVCIDHRPIIFIPNAFVPNGVNNIFKPTIFFGEPSNYSLQIYNRWGGKIFESNDRNIGWDGKDKSGTMQPQGGYAYLIKFIAADGVAIERKGIVLLIAK